MRILRLLSNPLDAELENDLRIAMPDHVEPEPKPVKPVAVRYVEGIGKMLDIERGNEMRLQNEIDELSEKLRQTRLVIASLEPAHAAIAKDAVR